MSSATNPRNTPAPGPGETQHNARDAALRGAISAFSKPPVKPKPLANTYTGGDNGALVAASKGWSGNRSSIGSPPGNLSPMQRQGTGGSQRPSPSPRRVLSNKSSSNTLDVPIDELDRIPSPSNIAAKLAAARHTPLKPKLHISREADVHDIMPPNGSVGTAKAMLNVPEKPSHKRSSSSGGASVTSAKHERPTLDHKPTDNTSIAPTSSLVKLFEQNRQARPTTPRNDSGIVPTKTPPPVRSPTPQRKFTSPILEPRELSGTKVVSDSISAFPTKQKPAQLAALKTTVPPPKPPSRRGTQRKSQDSGAPLHRVRTLSGSLDGQDIPSSPSSYASARETQPKPESKPRPDLPPPRRSAKTKSEIAEPSNVPQTQPIVQLTPTRPKAPSRNPSSLTPPEKLTRPRSSPPVNLNQPPNSTYHSNYQRESVRQITKHMTGDSLANAMLGAALASSRNPSPAPAPTLPPRHHQQQKKHHHHPFHSRSLSPPKTKEPHGKLRTTLRKEVSSSGSEDESERYKRKGTRVLGMGRKHPNKHHEGTRKRWRDTITERERKRYEGVWAANRGLYISSPSPSPYTSPSPSPSRYGGGININEPSDPINSDISSLVAKDIWTRSRLPENDLEEIWDLVDSRGIGKLRREEFVVGMWLIDQRLKGRKLPVKVGESVWGSVRGAAGVRVRGVGARGK